MPRYILAPAAERDIEQILAWSHERFGERARLRYEALLVRAIEDVLDDPQRAGSHVRPEIAAAARTYHLRHSRDRVRGAAGRVSRPRHFLLYRTLADGQVEIGRVLHDSMDLDRHLPDEYRPAQAGFATRLLAAVGHPRRRRNSASAFRSSHWADSSGCDVRS